MASPSRLRCPSCQSFRCRKSKWRSIDEKLDHQDGSHPYRCLDCDWRFFAELRVHKSRRNYRLVVFLAGTVCCIFALITVIFWAVKAGDPSAIPETMLLTTVHASDKNLRQAAEMGDSEAQFNLGHSLFNEPGRSAEKSAEALRWLESAAGNGHTEAMIFLGRLAKSGVGTLQDFSRASVRFRMAAEHGNPEGMLELGRLYRDGVGVEKNQLMAYAWFNRAAAAHNLDAASEREIISKILTPEELRQAQKMSSELLPESN